jgi:flagellar L-ring protein precursor FlgH
MKGLTKIFWGLLLSAFFTSTFAQNMGRNVSLFSDIKSDRVGKGITVMVMEYSQASNDARTEARKKSTHKVGVNQGTGLMSFLPQIGVNGEMQNDFKGDARTTKRGILKAKIAARIVGKNEAGDYIIEGKRVIEINNEKEVYVLSGAVRPEDIMANNTVYSYNIYDAHIVYKGKGEVSRAQKGGMLTRLLQWIF